MRRLAEAAGAEPVSRAAGRKTATGRAAHWRARAAVAAALAPLAVLAVILAAAAFLRFYDLAANPGRAVRRRSGRGARRLADAPPARLPARLPGLVPGRRRSRGALRLRRRRRLLAVRAVDASCSRGVAAAFGVAGVVAIWWLARRFGTWTALVAAAWAAGSLWLDLRQPRRDAQRHRAALRGAGAGRACCDGRTGPGAWHAAVAGAVTALAALYTYQPLKLLPVLAVSVVAVAAPCRSAARTSGCVRGSGPSAPPSWSSPRRCSPWPSPTRPTTSAASPRRARSTRPRTPTGSILEHTLRTHRHVRLRRRSERAPRRGRSCRCCRCRLAVVAAGRPGAAVADAPRTGRAR